MTRLAILCSGQAGQHAQMLDDFLVASDCETLRTLASAVLGQDVTTWWHSLDEAQIFSNANAQFAIALYQMVAWQRIAQKVPRPTVVAGYSMGEVMAWHIAGSLDAATTLKLIRQRAALMDRCTPGQGQGRCLLLWRGRSTPLAREACKKAMAAHGLSIAIYRPNGEYVLGGPAESVKAFLADPTVQQIDLRCLPVHVPSHTPCLSEAATLFFEAVVAAQPSDPAFPVLAGIDGMLLRKGEQAARALSAQLSQPVRWDWCQETLAALNVDVALELGPGNDLAKMLASGNALTVARALTDFVSPDAIVEWLQRHE